VALVEELHTSVPTTAAHLAAQRDTLFALLKRARAAVESNSQRAWRASLHVPLTEYIKALARLKLAEPGAAHAADPHDALLSAAIEGLIVLIDTHASDTREVVGALVLHSLASLAIGQDSFADDAVAAAMQLLLCLFDGTTRSNGHECSLKANRALWFEQHVDEQNSCVALLKSIDDVRASAATNDMQLALVKVLCALGSKAEQFRAPLFLRYLPGIPMVAAKQMLPQLLISFNDDQETSIASAHAYEVMLPDGTKVRDAFVHFQGNAVVVQSDASHVFLYEHFHKASLEERPFSSTDSNLEIALDAESSKSLCIALDEESVSRLERRGTFALLLGCSHKARPPTPVVSEPPVISDDESDMELQELWSGSRSASHAGSLARSLSPVPSPTPSPTHSPKPPASLRHSSSDKEAMSTQSVTAVVMTGVAEDARLQQEEDDFISAQPEVHCPDCTAIMSCGTGQYSQHSK